MSTEMQTQTPPTYTEAPASFCVKLLSPAGFDCMLTLRGMTGAELLPKAEALLAWANEHGYTPTPSNGRNGNGHAATTGTPNAEAPADVQTDDQGKRYRVCEVHQARMHEKAGKGGTWYSHQLADGTWCKGK